MSRVAGFNNRFNAGELAPEAWSDSDLQQHAHGCALGLNGVGRVAGPQDKRPGLLFVGLTKVQGEQSVLLPFARTPDDAVMIELGAAYGRIWRTAQTPVMVGPDVYEFTHTYTQAQLAGIRPRQAGDVIVLCHADSTVRTKRLKRTAIDNWTFGDFVFENGPWRAENIVTGHTITVTVGTATNDLDAATDSTAGTILPGGTVTLTASSALFEAGHVGALWRFRQSDGNPGVESWAPGKAFVTGEYCLSNGRVYKRAGGSGGAGTTPPVHEGGTISDGKMLWAYRHDGAGVVQITDVSSPTVATGTVLRGIPLRSTQSTSYWSEGAYSDYRGWPTAVPAVREERFVFGAANAEPDKFDATVTAGFTVDKGDFTPGLGTGRVVDSDAVRRFAGDEPSRIVWFMSGSQLVAGTTAQEVLISGATLDDPLSPSGCTARPLTDHGSADVIPVKAHDAILYVALGGQTLRELRVAPDQSFSNRDLSVLASHIAGRGIVELAWQKDENLLWARLADGGLAAFTYHAEQQVYGWTRQDIAGAGGGGWIVESLASLPGAGGRTVIWIIARRTKGGSPQRCILALSRARDGVRYDAAEIYEGSAVTGVSGLNHLEGEAVSLLASGAEYRGVVVTGGVASLPPGAPAATRIVAGLPYTWRFESLPLDLQGPGSTQGRKIKILQAHVVLTGVQAQVGESGQRLERVYMREPEETLTLIEKRHVAKVTFDGPAGTDPRIEVRDDSGFPARLHMIRPVADVNA
jgi:hypothetical protein